MSSVFGGGKQVDTHEDEEEAAERRKDLKAICPDREPDDGLFAE